MTAEEIYDVTIIGGGPVGLFGCFYAGLRSLKTKVIDSLPELGGQLSALYPEKYVYDMPGFPKILARDLAAQLIEQGTRFAPEVALSQQVLTIERQGDNTIRLTTDRQVHLSRTVIVCAGAGSFSPKRLDAPGVREYEGRGVHYFVSNKSQFKDRNLLIIGGGDSALDWCMNLEPIAGNITLAHRRDSFRAHEESIDWLLNRSTVATLLFWELEEVIGGEEIERVRLINNQTQDRVELEVDALLLNIGFNASIGPIKNWGLELSGHSICVNSRMETNLPGIYAAGDITTFDGKIKLIATGVGEVCTAVNHAKTYIDPTAKAFPGHSSALSL